MKKKVLIVIQLVRRGGVEMVAINSARALDKDKFEVSFLLIDPYAQEQDDAFLKELKSEGFSFTALPENCVSYMARYSFIKSYLCENRFDIVHSHVMLFSGLVLMAAEKAGVKVRASHSHIIKWNHKENLKYKAYKYVMQFLLKKYATHKFACVKAAGEFLYGKKEYNKNGIFIANGINTENFALDEKKRSEVRDEFKIEKSEYLVGHIGTIYRIKNQTFLVKVFAEFLKKYPNSKLMLVGEPVDTEPVIETAESLGVKDRLIITGQKSNIADFYSAFDIMIFPSLHEALPVSLIEAQASRLPCLISDAVTHEVKFNENVSFLSLDKSPSEWAATAGMLIETNRESIDIKELTACYDIKNVIKQLENYYLSDC